MVPTSTTPSSPEGRRAGVDVPGHTGPRGRGPNHVATRVSLGTTCILGATEASGVDPSSHEPCRYPDFALKRRPGRGSYISKCDGLRSG